MDASLIPSQIVEFLDRYIVGQKDAKRSVAIALRNRWRRMQLSEELRDEVYPKNIMMIGPTGVGKTEIARRIAKLVRAPFIKVEASKFTEVGYVGRDVESMIRDLVEIGITMTRKKVMNQVQKKAAENAEERILDLLLPPTPATIDETDELGIRDDSATRSKMAKKLNQGELDDRMIDIKVQNKPMGTHVEFFPVAGSEMDINIKELMSSIMPQRSKQRKTTVAEAKKIFTQEEAERLIDMDSIQSEAIQRVEESGIVFLDEIDKIVNREGNIHGGEVSREGVQRDLLPIVEGSTVSTKYGPVKTDFILFIGAGAFHVAKPSDMVPELQGRFPIRVELDSLSENDFIRILTEPKNSLIHQYIELMKTEGVNLQFEDEAIAQIARIACQVNEATENIGARRLLAVLEKLLDEISFNGPELHDQTVEINKKYVLDQLEDIAKDQDLSRYIL